MPNTDLQSNPDVKALLRKKEQDTRAKCYQKMECLSTQLHFYLLLQSLALKRIRDQYGITNTDFKLLSACVYHCTKRKTAFKARDVKKYIPFLWKDTMYKSFRRLADNGLIRVICSNNRKVYLPSHKGKACIRSYSAYLGLSYRELV